MNPKMKKGLAILLVFSMLFTIMPVSAFAATGDTFTVEGINYEVIADDKVKITGTTITTGELVLPQEVKNNDIVYSVTAIDRHAFYGSSLTSITIPDSVTTIGNAAFIYCRDLTSINIPAGVTSIGNATFQECEALASITIPASVTSIGDFVFARCTGLTSITIPASVTSIGNYAFYECTSLASVTIPASVTSIGEYAFSRCPKLESVTFGDNSNLETIGDFAFAQCTGLTSVTIPASVTSIGEYAFSWCPKLESVTFGDNSNLETIGDFAFAQCTGLASITIPASVTTIGQEAFSSSGLTSVTISEGVTSIDYAAFYYCTGLTSIDIPDSVTSIGNYAFYGCKGLTSIDIPDSVTTIGDAAFYYCTGLTSATISEGVISIGEQAFRGCSGLTSIDIPASVTSIGEDTFTGCSGLTTVNVPCKWDDSLYTFGSSVKVNREHKDVDNNHFCDICGEAVGTRPSSGSSSSGGGFSGTYNYPVKADKVDGADVMLSDEHATAGERVTITVTPDAGRQVREVIVTDASGKVIPVTKAGDNQYTFTMPEGKVNIKVTTEAAGYDLRIVMQINNKNIVANDKTTANDVAPVIVGDRTLVPVRVVTELLGGKADWNGATRTVTLTIDGKVLSMTIGREIPGFGTSAVIMNDRTYVPIRYVAEMLGAEVTWIQATQQIVIEK